MDDRTVQAARRGTGRLATLAGALGVVGVVAVTVATAELSAWQARADADASDRSLGALAARAAGAAGAADDALDAATAVGSRAARALERQGGPASRLRPELRRALQEARPAHPWLLALHVFDADGRLALTSWPGSRTGRPPAIDAPSDLPAPPSGSDASVAGPLAVDPVTARPSIAVVRRLEPVPERSRERRGGRRRARDADVEMASPAPDAPARPGRVVATVDAAALAGSLSGGGAEAQVALVALGGTTGTTPVEALPADAAQGALAAGVLEAVAAAASRAESGAFVLEASGRLVPGGDPQALAGASGTAVAFRRLSAAPVVAVVARALPPREAPLGSLTRWLAAAAAALFAAGAATGAAAMRAGDARRAEAALRARFVPIANRAGGPSSRPEPMLSWSPAPSDGDGHRDDRVGSPSPGSGSSTGAGAARAAVRSAASATGAVASGDAEDEPTGLPTAAVARRRLDRARQRELF